MVLSEEQGRHLVERVLALSKADSVSVDISSSERTNLRFANNEPTTNGSLGGISLTIESNFGTRSASVATDRSDSEGLAEAVERSEVMAKLAPENPEFMPPLGPQEYGKANSWDEQTATAGMSELAAAAAPVIEAARAAKVRAAGFLERDTNASISANSAGMFFYQPSTKIDFSVTARTETDRGSGWASRQATALVGLDLTSVGERAIGKALASRRAVAAEPGRHVVVLESPAVRDLVSSLVFSLGRRSVDEGRSFLTGLGGPEAVGKAVFGGRATVTSDPSDARAPGRLADWSGLPATRETWLDSGVLRQLHCGRFWAQKQGVEAQAHPTNLLIAGDGLSSSDLIADVEHGFLVTRLWYIRMVQPQTLLLTGLTRDGTFRIENGEIAGPVKNFRFNESPVNVMKNLAASGVPERVLGSEGAMPMLAPPMLIDGFNFSSVSDAS